MAGLGSFMQGFMEGGQFSSSLKNQKQRRKLLDENAEWTREQRGREREAWGRQQKAWAREDKERSVLQAIGQEAVDTYDEGGDEAQPELRLSTRSAVAGEVPPTPGQKGTEPDKTKAVYSPPSRGVTDVTATAPERHAPVDVAPDVLNAPGADAPVQRSPQPRGIIAPDSNDNLPQSQMFAVLAADPSIQAMAAGAGQAPEQFVAAMHPEAVRQNYERIASPKPFDKEADDRAYQKFASTREEALPTQSDLDHRHRDQMFAERYNVTSRPSHKPVATAAAPIRPAPLRPGPSSAAPAMQPAPQGERNLPAVDNMTPPTTKEGAEVEEVVARAARMPPDQGGAPSVAIATATAPKQGRGVIGPKDAVKTTKKAKEKAVNSFLDHYAETAVPKIVQYYAGQGQIEKAEAYETWANARETKAMQKSWAEAIHAITIGDESGFIDGLSDVYNSYDDGYTVVRDQSDFIRDEQGNITGAKITFKSAETGETFEKLYEDQTDIINEAVFSLSPEQVFERLFSQIAQASEVAANQRGFEQKVILEQVKAGVKAPAGNAKLIASAKKQLSETYGFGQKAPNGKTWTQMTPDEQDQMALDYVRSNQRTGQQLSQPPKPAPYTGG